jgi:hypothetical protein
MPVLRLALRCLWALIVGLTIGGVLAEMAGRPAEAGAVTLGLLAIWYQGDSELRKPPCVARRPRSDHRRSRRGPKIRQKARTRRSINRAKRTIRRGRSTPPRGHEPPAGDVRSVRAGGAARTRDRPLDQPAAGGCSLFQTSL